MTPARIAALRKQARDLGANDAATKTWPYDAGLSRNELRHVIHGYFLLHFIGEYGADRDETLEAMLNDYIEGMQRNDRTE